MKGSYIDPRVTPSTTRERKLLDLIRARGLVLVRLHASGSSVRLTGPGIHVTAATLAGITFEDVDPDAVGRDTRRR